MTDRPEVLMREGAGTTSGRAVWRGGHGPEHCASRRRFLLGAVGSCLLASAAGCRRLGDDGSTTVSVPDTPPERLPKAAAGDAIVGFDAACDAGGRLAVIWATLNDRLHLCWQERAPASWATPRHLGSAGRCVRLVCPADGPHALFVSGSEIYGLLRLPTGSQGGGARRVQVFKAPWVIAAYDVVTEGRDLVVACVSKPPAARLGLWRYDPRGERVVAQGEVALPTAASAREPDVAMTHRGGVAFVVVRQDEESVHELEVPLATLAAPAWETVPMAASIGANADAPTAGHGSLLEQSLALSPWGEGLALTFAGTVPCVLFRNAAGRWSPVSVLAPAGSGAGTGVVASAASVGRAGCLAWIDARDQRKSVNPGFPWSDRNPYWGNNDVYWRLLTDLPAAAADPSLHVPAAAPRRLTLPLGFARTLRMVPCPATGRIQLFWLGTDRVARAPSRKVGPWHGVFHRSLYPS